MNKLEISWLTLVAGLVVQPLMAQPSPASLKWSRAPDSTNLILQISTQPGFFYTLQDSADLAKWASQESVYAEWSRRRTA